MADQIALRVAESIISAGSAVSVTAAFRDRATSAASTPSSIRYRVDCLTNRTNVLNWTSVSAASSVEIDVAGGLNAIIDSENETEKRQLLVEIDTGLSTQVRAAIPWTVRNIHTFVPSASFQDDLLLEPYYPINAAERAAGELEANLGTTYFYGDVRRYGGSEGADISTALSRAILSNNDVSVPLASCSAGAVNLRAGVAIRGQGKYATTIERVGASPIFTNAAATTGCRISDMTLDASDDYTNPVCSFEPGTNKFRGERLRFINFDSGTSGCAGFNWDSDTTVRNEKITLDDIEFDNEGAPVTANYQSILIHNYKGIRITNSDFLTCGAIALATATSFTGICGDVLIADNRLVGVDSSAILIRLNGAATLNNVVVMNNQFNDISPTLGKLCVTVQQAPTTTGGTFRNIYVLGNTARCTDVNCAGFFVSSLIGAAAISGFTVSNNTCDFTDSAGAVHTTGNATQRGIWLFGDTSNLATNISVTNNTIRGSQSFGVGVSGCLGFTIAGNTLDQCVTNSASGGVAIESGIYIPQGTSRQGIIVGNTVVNSGGGGATQSGIGSASSSAVSHIHCADNTCIDNRGGSAAMVYGLNFGAASTDITYGFNRSIGHTTAAINPASPGVVAYTVTNHTADRTYDANASTTAELADVIGTILLDKVNGRYFTASIS